MPNPLPLALRPLLQGGTLSGRAADIVRERILAGDFKLGERLVEAGIARQLGISRGPVREALKQLRAEGLVHELPRRGSFVVDLSEVDIAEIYDLRAAIEVRSVRLAIGRRSGVAEIGEALTALREACADGDHDRFSRCDLAFHEAICVASGNARLHRLFVGHASILGLLLRLERKRHHVSLDVMLGEHEEIYEAIVAADAERAESICDAHLTCARNRLLARRLETLGGTAIRDDRRPT